MGTRGGPGRVVAGKDSESAIISGVFVARAWTPTSLNAGASVAPPFKKVSMGEFPPHHIAVSL